MRQFAAPLKVSASSKLDTGDSGSGSGSSSTRVGNQPGTNAAPGSRAFAGASGASKAKGIGSATATSPLGPSKIEDISSPHELTAYVEQLITQIEGKFDDMSAQILERMNAMSSRVDALEVSIQDLINSDVQPTTPGTPGTSR